MMLLIGSVLGACQRADFVLFVPDDAALITSRNGSDAAVTGFVDMGVAPEGCGDFTPGPEFQLCSATYVGGDGEDRAEAVAIGGDGSIVVAGNFVTDPYGLTPRELPTRGDGALLRLSGRGSEARSLTRVGARVRDMEIQRGGAHRIALATDRGVMVLDSRASVQVWAFELAAGAERVSIGSEGTVAAIDAEDIVHLWNAAGSPLAAFGLEAAAVVADVAVDDHGQTVFVVGARRAVGECSGLLPFLRAFDLEHRPRWTAYDFPDAGGACSSSQGRRIVMGNDGLLYYVGHNQGGNSVHLKDPADLAIPAPVVSYDAYTRGSGRATQTFGFVARFHPDTGAMLSGQMLLPRDGETGGRLLVNAVTADRAGNVYLAGEASCCLSERDAIEVGGVVPGPYVDGDLFVAIVARDFTERLSWVTWTGGDGASGVATGVAVGEDLAAVVANQRGTTSAMITRTALQERPAEETEAFISVWPAATTASGQ
jgi:hypothetical protein